jgi:hypothetical protein
MAAEAMIGSRNREKAGYRNFIDVWMASEYRVLMVE